MRGSPLLQTLLLAAVLALAALPVWKLTRPRPPVEAAPPSSAPESSVGPVELTVTSTADADVELTHSGTTLWRSGAPSGHFETTLSLPTDAELVVRVQWTHSGTHAARFRLSRDGGLLTETTLWGEQEASDVLAVSPIPDAP
jgi:hypothetical protein